MLPFLAKTMPRKEMPDSFKDRLHADAAVNRLGNILERFRPYLRTVARQRASSLGRRLDSSDIVQDTLMSALRGWAGFNGTTEGEFAAWLRQILIRRTIDLVRQKDASETRKANWAKQNSKYEDFNGFCARRIRENHCPQQHVVDREMTETVMEAVQNLPKDYREIIMLRHFRGLSLDEAATHMCRSYDSAEKLWARGLARLA